MKKILLASLLGLASSVSAAMPYDWTDMVFVQTGGHFYGALHEYETPDQYDPEGWREICFGGGVGQPSGDSIGFSLCASDAIDVPYKSIVNGFQVNAKRGLHLRYNMGKSQFEAALRAADIRYVG